MIDAGVLRAWRDSGLARLMRAGALTPRESGAGELPAVFNLALSRAKASPAFALTYADLGLDMGGKPDPARRELWTWLIGQVKALSGSTAFLPCSRLDETGLVMDPSSFWRCIGRLGPRVLMVFGERALTALFAFARDFGGRFYHRNMAVLVFPEPEALLPIASEACMLAVQRLDDFTQPAWRTTTSSLAENPQASHS